MRKPFLFAVIVFFAAALQSCAAPPFHEIRVPDAAISQRPYPLNYIVAIKEFPRLSNPEFAPAYGGDLRADMRKILASRLDSARIFFLVAPEESAPDMPEFYLTVSTLRVSFTERESAFLPIFLSALTLGVYPAAGGVFWQPRASIEMEIEVRDRRGKTALAFTSRGEAEDEVPLYAPSERSPGPVFNRAFSDVLEKIAAELESHSSELGVAAVKAQPQDYPPPLIIIESPENGCRIAGGVELFKGRVLAKEGIESCEIRLDGGRIGPEFVKFDRFGGDMLFFRAYICVEFGAHVFECRVSDKLGRETRRFVNVVFPPPMGTSAKQDSK
jgi:hypothetical protein